MKMPLSPTQRLLIVFAIMSGFLLFMAIDHEHRRNSGTEVVLDMEPVDPRSLFRGHYVRIRTSIHQLEPHALQGENDFTRGQTIYVSVAIQENGNWEPVAITHKQPGADTIFIKGIVKSTYTSQVFSETPRPDNLQINVQYNIESYFADEVSAKRLEAQVRDHKMRLILSVGGDGRAIIKGIEIDGQRQLDTLW